MTIFTPRILSAALLSTACLIAGTARAEKVVLVVASTPEQPFKNPFGVALDEAGNVYIAEGVNGERVLKYDASGKLTHIAGTGKKGHGGDGGPALNAEFNFIHDIAVTKNGDIYVADTHNLRVRKIDPKTGLITAIAGTGVKSATGDGGPATKATLDGVASFFFTPDQSKLYVGGFTNRVRVVDMATGLIGAVKGLPGGRSVAADSKGNVYVAGGQTLRVRRPDGAVETLIDAQNLAGSKLPLANNPKHMALDADENVLIADEGNHRIRKYLVAEKRLIDVAGSGKKGSAGLGGSPHEVQLASPHGLYFHRPTGEIYIADTYNHRILKIAP